MKIASRTDIGRVRASNQDALLIRPGVFGLYGVADGMGGHQSGDVASRMAVALLGEGLEGAKPDAALLRAAMEEVNGLIFEAQQKDEALSGMGTTLTVLWEDEKRLLLGHVGDSRAYRLHDNELTQISCDHSLVGEMLRSGLITPEQAKRHPYRNVITRAVGTSQTIEADISVLEKHRGDLYLLCSDGLTEYVTPEQIRHILLHMPKERAADEMMRLALEGGGRDNITLLIAEVTA